MGGDPASFGAVVNVPFSWEHKPGVSKATDEQIRRRRHDHDELIQALKYSSSLIPPPPPLKSSKLSNYPPAGESSGLALGKLLPAHHRDDPFLVAYWKCTDQEVDDAGAAARSRRRWSSSPARRKKRAAPTVGLLCSPTTSLGGFSCKYSCGVRSDNLVRVSSSSSRMVARPNWCDK